MSATRAEWILDDSSETISYFDEHGERQIVVYELGTNADANRLIAAAPDLLEALQLLVQQCESVGMTTRDDMPFIEAAHEAIKKATGATK